MPSHDLVNLGTGFGNFPGNSEANAYSTTKVSQRTDQCVTIKQDTQGLCRFPKQNDGERAPAYFSYFSVDDAHVNLSTLCPVRALLDISQRYWISLRFLKR